MSETLPAKACKRCLEVKPLTEFHRQKSGPMGRHSWCSQCANAYYKERRPPATPEKRHRWNLSRRYGLTLAQFNAMRKAQSNLCAICETPMSKPKVDHDHITGKVRGLLCHRCNLLLSGLEDETFRQRAMAYLTSSSADFLAKI